MGYVGYTWGKLFDQGSYSLVISMRRGVGYGPLLRAIARTEEGSNSKRKKKYLRVDLQYILGHG